MLIQLIRLCFVKASETTKLDETLISFFWILFFYLRPMVSQICLVVWIALTLPYVIQLISLVAGLNSAMRLEEMPSPYTTVLIIKT
ncbi:hypothetical protein DAPPUDRAFT_233642 [Daphnia pulex]|uniref:Uncharacterized protein n=1 Tax=Daphnia pulex TaxID=6669 RepID=E9FVC4_DAPPU|nr:hypothetical protein DAPPUDRAFT_233642 [Daphnia pulex]|eukprot:EFX89133.1 hypothetical protein DAPPUDRAFT_233642 [Daphnia pulex]